MAAKFAVNDLLDLYFTFTEKRSAFKIVQVNEPSPGLYTYDGYFNWGDGYGVKFDHVEEGVLASVGNHPASHPIYRPS